METKQSLATRTQINRALIESFSKLNFRQQIRNPVMFVVFIGSILTTALGVRAAIISGSGDGPVWFIFSIAIWLWLTVLFANFSEAVAEGRGKAQADELRKTRKDVTARRLSKPDRNSATQIVLTSELRRGEFFLVVAGDTIPTDGEIVEGVASVDESAITGESAPVIRESGGDRNSVTGGTKIISDWLVVRVTAQSGESFLDRMISLVEGAKRQRTPNEIALSILLASLTIIFLLVCVTLLPMSIYSVKAAGSGQVVSIPVLIALLICLAPTTIGGLMSAIGIAGMDRMLRKNILATSGRAVEAAGDVDVLLLDKTGTITLGNRQATMFYAVAGVDPKQLAEVAYLSSLSDETPEGRSIVILAKNQFGLPEQGFSDQPCTFIPFSAHTRLSGVDLPGRVIRKGAGDSIRKLCIDAGLIWPTDIQSIIDRVAKTGGTPLVASENGRPLGVIELKDIVKSGIKERFAQLRQMGIKTVMITGDNPLTAAAIAAEAGVDDFLAEATPEAKLKLIREYQTGGRLVAMTGDGTNDAPALAQADVAVAMNSGTQAAKEAGNMVDLDSDPTKLIEVVETGKQLLMTRGALTTFSLSNDVAKYFAIIPAAFAATYPALKTLDVMNLHSPESAILSAVIFNAIIIILLVPLALKGVAYMPLGAAAILKRNLVIYGLGGLIVPFFGIKIIDLLLTLLIA